MNSSQQKSSLVSILARTSYFFFAIPVGLIVTLAIWLTATAAYENVKFVHCTDQMLFVLGTARSDASKDPVFGEETGEDVIEDFVQRGQLPGPLVNSWGGEVRAEVPTPPFIRIETDVPVHACRRLASFFGKDASALGLQKMEAREEKNKWVTIYDSSANTKDPYSQWINAACGDGSYAAFALTLRLR